MSVCRAAVRWSDAETHRDRRDRSRGGMLHGDCRLRAQPGAASTGSERMTRPTPKDIRAMANVAGLPVDDEVAARIANSIGPGFEGFAAVAGTLPFDLEPATFTRVQSARE